MSTLTDPTHGFFIIDKPIGLTSHDVVRQIRHVLPRKTKVGHTGTLDPFATGVLIITIGQTTRLSEYTLSLPKTYRATIHMGETSTTDDGTGLITSIPETEEPTLQAINATMGSFKGVIQQVPPAYAAIKVKGKKLYEYAREGRVVERQPRSVIIYDLTVESYTYPTLTLTVTCGSGTYIRSLGRDIGEVLKTGAYVQELRRTAIGPFTEQKAKGLEDLTAQAWPQYLQPSEQLISHLPRIAIASVNVAKFKSGGSVLVEHSPETSNGATPEFNSVAIFTSENTFLGIGRYDSSTSLLHPQKVLTM
ncbi:MAG: tRNA pseudouridine(55) synthase TruB [Candidatus Andersenbacteria bacterium]